jgi:hypothetical protein
MGPAPSPPGTFGYAEDVAQQARDAFAAEDEGRAQAQAAQNAVSEDIGMFGHPSSLGLNAPPGGYTSADARAGMAEVSAPGFGKSPGTTGFGTIGKNSTSPSRSGLNATDPNPDFAGLRGMVGRAQAQAQAQAQATTMGIDEAAQAAVGRFGQPSDVANRGYTDPSSVGQFGHSTDEGDVSDTGPIGKDQGRIGDDSTNVGPPGITGFPGLDDPTGVNPGPNMGKQSTENSEVSNAIGKALGMFGKANDFASNMGFNSPPGGRFGGGAEGYGGLLDVLRNKAATGILDPSNPDIQSRRPWGGPPGLLERPYSNPWNTRNPWL